MLDDDISPVVFAVLDEFFPDGLPPSVTAEVIASGKAKILNPPREQHPLLDLTDLWSEEGEDEVA
jgi:hypothetical protein